MPTPYQFTAATELLGQILTSPQPADAVMDRYFRSHPKLGVRDRGFIAETVYTCLRRKRSLTFLAAGTSAGTATAADLVAACLLTTQGVSARALTVAGYRANAVKLSEQVRTQDPQAMPPAVRHDLPDWLESALQQQYGATETESLASAMCEPASLDLRVNTLKSTREAVATCLAEAGAPVQPTPFSPLGLRRQARVPLFGTRCFKEGWFEVQDEGSQLLTLLIEPRRHEMVVDFCAGAGGKTLLLAAQMANSGSIYAFDVSPKRLDRLKPRLARAGVHNVRSVVIQNERDTRVQRLAGKIDRVLVDAPCSGSGTLRRSPDLKWKTPDLHALVATQRSILASAATLAKPGGRLVYATCSLMQQENEEVVREFLQTHPGFHLCPARAILERRGIHLPEPVTDQDEFLHLFPHRHQTDGFFAAVLEREKTA